MSLKKITNIRYVGTKIFKFTQLSLCYSMITNHELSKKGALWTVCLQIQVFLQVSCFSFYCRSRYRCFRTGAKSIWSCAGASTNASIVYLLKYILEHRTCADTSVCYMHLRSVQKAFFTFQTSWVAASSGRCIQQRVMWNITAQLPLDTLPLASKCCKMALLSKFHISAPDLVTFMSILDSGTFIEMEIF